MRGAPERPMGRRADPSQVGTRSAHKNHNHYGSHQHPPVRFPEDFSSGRYPFLSLLRILHRRFSLHEPAFGAIQPPNLSPPGGSRVGPRANRSTRRSYPFGGIIRTESRPDLLGIICSEPHSRGRDGGSGWDRRSFVHSAVAGARQLTVSDAVLAG